MGTGSLGQELPPQFSAGLESLRFCWAWPSEGWWAPTVGRPSPGTAKQRAGAQGVPKQKGCTPVFGILGEAPNYSCGPGRLTWAAVVVMHAQWGFPPKRSSNTVKAYVPIRAIHHRAAEGFKTSHNRRWQVCGAVIKTVPGVADLLHVPTPLRSKRRTVLLSGLGLMAGIARLSSESNTSMWPAGCAAYAPRLHEQPLHGVARIKKGTDRPAAYWQNQPKTIPDIEVEAVPMRGNGHYNPDTTFRV